MVLWFWFLINKINLDDIENNDENFSKIDLYGNVDLYKININIDL